MILKVISIVGAVNPACTEVTGGGGRVEFRNRLMYIGYKPYGDNPCCRLSLDIWHEWFVPQFMKKLDTRD